MTLSFYSKTPSAAASSGAMLVNQIDSFEITFACFEKQNELDTLFASCSSASLISSVIPPRLRPCANTRCRP